MRWMTYFFLSLPVAVLGLLGAGFVANAAVRWYRVSSFEGKSGFFVIGWALAGAVVAFVASLVILGMLRPQEGAGYLRGLGVVTGILAGALGTAPLEAQSLLLDSLRALGARLERVWTAYAAGILAFGLAAHGLTIGLKAWAARRAAHSLPAPRTSLRLKKPIR